jgi:DNA-binding ferritin-like protein
MADNARARGDDAQADELAERTKRLGYEPPVIPSELLTAFESGEGDDVFDAWRKLAARTDDDDGSE